MKALTIFLSLFCVVTTLLWAEEDVLLSPFWEFYSDNHLSLTAAGRGYAGAAESGDITLCNINPASLTGNGNGWAAATVYKTRMPWLVDWMHLTASIPSVFIGGSKQLGEAVTVGLIYIDCYSYTLDFGEVEVTEVSGDALETIDSYDHIRISRISLPIAFKAASAFAVGLDLGGNWVHRKSVGIINSKVDRFNVVPKIGFIVGPVFGFSFGITATPQNSTSYECREALLSGYPRTYHYTNVYPGRLVTGFKYQGINTSYYLDFNYINTGINENQIDRRDFNLGAERRRGIWVYRLGLFSVRDYRNPEIEWIEEVGHDSQYFLTAGIEKTDGRVKYAVNILDSHILSRGDFKTTKIQAGLKYSFQK